MLAKDFGSLDCYATEFLIDGSTLSLVVSDAQKNIQVIPAVLKYNDFSLSVIFVFYMLAGGQWYFELDTQSTFSVYIGKRSSMHEIHKLNKGKLVACHLKTLNLAKYHFKTLTPSNATLK
jgi:hypothetical protein